MAPRTTQSTTITSPAGVYNDIATSITSNVKNSNRRIDVRFPDETANRKDIGDKRSKKKKKSKPTIRPNSGTSLSRPTLTDRSSLQTSETSKSSAAYSESGGDANGIAPTVPPTTTHATNPMQDPMMNGGMYGGGMPMMGGMGMGGMGGMGMGGMGGMGMGGMGSMGMGYGNSGDGYLNSMTNSVFQFQSLVFTVGQAVQIVGMNTQALSQMYQSMKGLIYECRDQMTIAVKVIQQEQSRAFALSTINENEASEEDIRRARIVKRRIQVLRWSMAIMVSIGGYKMVKYLLSIIFGARRRNSMVTAAASAAVPFLSSNVNNATQGHGNSMTNGDYYGNHRGTQPLPSPVNDNLSPHNAAYSPYNTYSNGGGATTLPVGQLGYNQRSIDHEYGRRLDSHYNGGHNGMNYATSYR